MLNSRETKLRRASTFILPPSNPSATSQRTSICTLTSLASSSYSPNKLMNSFTQGTNLPTNSFSNYKFPPDNYDPPSTPRSSLSIVPSVLNSTPSSDHNSNISTEDRLKRCKSFNYYVRSFVRPVLVANESFNGSEFSSVSRNVRRNSFIKRVSNTLSNSNRGLLKNLKKKISTVSSLSNLVSESRMDLSDVIGETRSNKITLEYFDKSLERDYVNDINRKYWWLVWAVSNVMLIPFDVIVPLIGVIGVLVYFVGLGLRISVVLLMGGYAVLYNKVMKYFIMVGVVILVCLKTTLLSKTNKFIDFDYIILLYNIILMHFTKLKHLVFIFVMIFFCYILPYVVFNVDVFTPNSGIEEKYLTEPEGYCVDYVMGDCIDITKKHKQFLLSIIFIAVMFALSYVNIYIIQKKDRNLYLQKRQYNKVKVKLKFKVEEQDRLLGNMFPQCIVETLKKKIYTRFITRYKRVATIVYKIDNFYSEVWKFNSPEVIIKKLNKNLTILDNIIKDTQFEKMKSYEDTYICIGGLEGNEEKEQKICVKAVNIAIKMRELLNGGKIGISFGRLILALFGKQKLTMNAFDYSIEKAKNLSLKALNKQIILDKRVCKMTKENFECEKVVDKVSSSYYYILVDRKQCDSNFHALVTPMKFDTKRLRRVKSIFEIKDSSFFLHQKKSTEKGKYDMEELGFTRYNKITLGFKNLAVDREFLINEFKSSHITTTLIFIIQFVIMIYVSFSSRILYPSKTSFLTSFMVLLSLIQILLAISFWCVVNLKNVFSFYLTMFLLYVSYFDGVIFSLLVVVLSNDLNNEFIIFCSCWNVISLFTYPLIRFYFKLVWGISFHFIFFLIPLFIHFGSNNYGVHLVFYKAFIISSITLIVQIVSTYHTTLYSMRQLTIKRKMLNSIRSFIEENNLNEEIIHTFLPKFIINDIKNEENLCRFVKSGCLLLIRINGFKNDDFYNSFNFLSTLFEEVETLVSSYSSKGAVISIVKSYNNSIFIASGFEEGCKSEFALNLSIVAIEISDRFRKLIQLNLANKTISSSKWSYKLGLHSCDFISSIIGEKRMCFDLIGQGVRVLKLMLSKTGLNKSGVFFLEENAFHKHLSLSQRVRFDFVRTEYNVRGQSVYCLHDYEINEQSDLYINDNISVAESIND